MRAFSAFIASILLLASAFAAQVKVPARPPDIFLVTIDTLRADHVHCYGYEQIQTPALDALAKDGVRFAEAFTPSPITNSSHTSILTGLLPSSHGVTDFAVPLADSHPTLAELLKAKGYHTAAFIGAVILDSNTLAPGLDRGFDFYDNFPPNTKPDSHWERLEHRGEVVVQHAQSWLTAHSAGPHFVWVHLYDPHDPYEPPAPYSQTYKDRLYDGEISYADSVLGRFIAYLKAHGWYENALVIAVGDHGEGLGDHHEDTHGIFLYDSTTHVPLIFKLPAGKLAGKEISTQVRTLDIFPSVLDFVGIAPPDELDGESLTPLFNGGQNDDRVAFGETQYPLRFGWAPIQSVRADGKKFIEAPRPELYDLSTDPNESKNTYGPESDLAKAFRAKLAGSRMKPADKSSSLPDPKDKIEEQNLLHRAMIASQDDRLDEARQALEQVLQRDPKSALTLRQLGEVEVRTGAYAKAAEYLKRAREVSPDDAAVAFLLGQALLKTNDADGARSVLEASLKINPNEPLARVLLGRVYLDLKSPDAAADQFEAALLLQPANVDAQLGLARIQIAAKKFADALPVLQGLAKSQPKSAEVFELLGQSYRGLGKTIEAQKAEKQAQLLRKQ